MHCSPAAQVLSPQAGPAATGELRVGAAALLADRLDRDPVLGERRGRSPRPHLVFSAHLDTVFPEGTDVKVNREGTLLRGPGIEIPAMNGGGHEIGEQIRRAREARHAHGLAPHPGHALRVDHVVVAGLLEVTEPLWTAEWPASLRLAVVRKSS